MELLLKKTEEIFAPLIERLKFVQCIGHTAGTLFVTLNMAMLNSNYDFTMSAKWSKGQTYPAQIWVSKFHSGAIFNLFTAEECLSCEEEIPEKLNSIYDTLMSSDYYRFAADYEKKIAELRGQLDALNIGIANLRQVSDDYLTNVDNLLYLKLLSTHFEYAPDGDGYQKAKERFESQR